MSQSSATESEDSGHLLESQMVNDVFQPSRTDIGPPLGNKSDDMYEFDDLVDDLAEYFLSYERKELDFWDSTHRPRISEFIRILSMFVSTVSGGQFTISKDDTYIFCLECLWNANFLSHLLILRKVDNRAEDASQQAMIAQNCLMILGSLENMVLILVHPNTPQRELPSSLRARQQEDTLRAVAQLPDHLCKFPDVLASKHSSRAAKRHALSILFGLIVVEPAGDQWADLKIDPSRLLKCLQHFIHDVDPSAQRNIFAQEGNDTRVSFAIIWALYSTVQCMIDPGGGASAFQPHTLSILLSMLNCVFANGDPLDSGATFYVQSPDAAQVIVLQWGDCIPFAWSKWEDARVLDFGLIIKLTANWMCHLDQKSLPCSSSCEASESSAPSRMMFIRALAFNHSFAIAAISRQVGLLSDNEKTQDHAIGMRLVHICRCAQFIKLFMEATQPGLDCVTLIEDFLVILFTLDASEEQLPVKGEILSLLCSMHKEHLGSALTRCRSDPKRRFEMKIEDNVREALRRLQTRHGPGCDEDTVGLTPCSLVDLLALLNLICLICSTGSTLCLTASVVSLLSTVLIVIDSGTLPFACCLYATDLRAAILSCLTSFEALHRDSGGVCDSTAARPLYKLWDDNAAFALALNAGAWSHLPLSSAFATYVISNTKPLVKDRLLCVEAWNYLRDTLLLNLPQTHKTSDQTANDCLKNVCKGLRRILKQADESAVRYIRASPMLFNLGEALSSAVHRRREGNEDQAYASFVVACEELLAILNKNTPDTIP